jgi:RNA polymerase sigma factor (sigma-70 family)
MCIRDSVGSEMCIRDRMSAVKKVDFNRVQDYGITSYLMQMVRRCILLHLRDTVDMANRGMREDGDWVNLDDIELLTDEDILSREQEQPDECYEKYIEAPRVLLDAIETLTPRQQEVIHATLSSNTQEDAAKKLGMTVGTFKQTASQARASLAPLTPTQPGDIKN